jgi:dockerin type I repeat protein
MSRRSLSRRNCTALLAGAAVLTLCDSSRATIYNWNGQLNTPNWNQQIATLSNWDNGGIPLSATATQLLFGSFLLQGSPNQNISNPFVLNNIGFTGTASFTLNGSPLEPEANAVLGRSHFTQNSGTIQTINEALILDEEHDFNGTGSGTVLLNGAVNGTGGIQKSGSYVLAFGTNSTTTHSLDHLNVIGGTVQVNPGVTLSLNSTLTVADANHPLSLNGGSLTVLAGGTLTTAGDISIDGPPSSPSVLDFNGCNCPNAGQSIFAGASSDGEVIVENSANVTAYNVTAGYSGNGSGTVIVRSGGVLNVTNIGNGLSAGMKSSYLITGPNSAMHVIGDLALFNGTMTISNGGHLSSGINLDMENSNTALIINSGSASTDVTIESGAKPVIQLSDPPGSAALVLIAGHFPRQINSDITDASTGPGSITDLNGELLDLTGSNTYTGTTTVDAGRITQLGGANSSAIQVNGGSFVANGATLNVSTRTLTAAAGTSIDYIGNSLVNGGTLTGAGLHIIDTGGARFSGTEFASDSTVLVNGAATFSSVINRGSLTCNQPLSWAVGSDASGATIAFNAQASLSSFSSAGTITVNNGGSIVNSFTSLVLNSSSHTIVNSGGQITLQGTGIDLTGTLMNSGTISGAINAHGSSLVCGTGTFPGLSLSDSAVLSPGASVSAATFSASAIAVAGALSMQSGNTLRIELGGTSPGSQFDQVNVSGGSATLNGTLAVGFGNSFTPSAGQSFTILSDSSGISGQFSQTTGRMINATTWLATIYSSTSVRLAVALPGDDTLDGKVNTSDFTALATHFSQTSQSWLTGDFNGDGKVNAIDFNLLATNFGKTAPAPVLGDVVPEPAMAILSIAFSLPHRSRRGRHRQRR